MNNALLLPKLALSGIKRNASSYVPYLLANTLCVCVFNIFLSISQNELMRTFPYADYLGLLMIIGAFLLAIILAPFLVGINKFLIKQRKTELGLYSILGLDKKNIGTIMFIETIVLYVISIALGMITATVFSKLIFMLLLNITQFPIETEYTTNMTCFAITLIYFGAISLFNLASTLFGISVANPAELFSSGKKGEKEPKFLWPYTLFGILTLGGGYIIAIRSKMNSMVFTDFFFAVLLVILGTYFLFTSGSIVFLRLCRKNKKLYYKSENFVTISGMLYRMKKNSASLVNICIFSTMTIITVIFTCVVFIGKEGAFEFQYPFDAEYYFDVPAFSSEEELDEIISETADANNVIIDRKVKLKYDRLFLQNEGNRFIIPERYSEPVKMIDAETYNKLEGKNVTLEKDEILFFTATEDIGTDEIFFGDHAFKVKEELQTLSLSNKNNKNYGTSNYLVVFSDKSVIDGLTSELVSEDYTAGVIYSVRFNVIGDNADEFITELNEKATKMSGFNTCDDVFSWRAEGSAIFGGLLFLGIFFGLVFMMCLILIMYYKQITEGYEDRRNFEIMQKVGMNDKEVKATISRQIMMIFFLPLLTALIHTIVASNIISNLVAALQIYNSTIIFLSIGITVIAFAVCYAISYIFTARAYYKIVK